MMLLSILIQLIVLFLLAIAIALPLAGGLYFFSKHKRRRKAILGLISPFAFVFSFYFLCLIGGFICTSAFKTGCGMDGYWHTDLPNGYEIESTEYKSDKGHFTGNISKDGKQVIEWVTKVKISGDMIYGERYDVNEVPGSEYYFSLDTGTGKQAQYISIDEVQQLYPTIVTELTDLESFYYQSWSWVVPLGISSFVISVGLVFLMWIVMA